MGSENGGGRIVPFYLTESGDVYPIGFEDLDQLDFIGQFIAHSLGGIVRVDFNQQINDPMYRYKISVVKKKI